MNKRTFIQYISESNFKELFIREMGWNNPKGQTKFDITIEETTYEFQQIADRSGFQVLTCEVDDIPSSSMCKKIDTRLRRTANDYICIYHIPRSEHHLWVVPVKKVEKRDLVLVEYELASKADFLYEKMEDLCFDFDERTTIMDVKEKVQAGFIINSEKITKGFLYWFSQGTYQLCQIHHWHRRRDNRPKEEPQQAVVYLGDAQPSDVLLLYPEERFPEPEPQLSAR